MSKIWIILLILVALTASGCSDDKTSKYSTPEGDVEVTVHEGEEDDWCPVGTKIDMANPNNGEMASMEIVGKETIDGIEMCKAVVEMVAEEENDVARLEYMWSEDRDTFYYRSYDSSNHLITEMIMKDGKMTMTDEEGNVMEMNGMT
ncbi:MAG: membrane-binding protein [Methanosarcinaceae archaeon]|nr:membrane-binding protein [Methanosarcinaceae archaeon]